MPTLNWIGKDKVINHHLEVPFRVLDHQYGFIREGKQDNTDSLAKCRLGNQWQQLTGDKYSYFMVFDSKPIMHAFMRTQAKEMLQML
jgi:hypothetical protein